MYCSAKKMLPYLLPRLELATTNKVGRAMAISVLQVETPEA